MKAKQYFYAMGQSDKASGRKMLWRYANKLGNYPTSWPAWAKLAYLNGYTGV